MAKNLKENKNRLEVSNEAAEVWKRYEDSVSYMGSMGITSQIQKNIDFYEGRQWPAPTKDTLGMPRPIIDITAFTVDNKCANIAGVPVKIVFTAPDNEKAKTLNEFTEYWAREQRFRSKYRKLVTRAANDCSSCFHLYFNKGKLKLEIIDIRNVHVSDPSNCDIQEMDWVIISSRKPISTVRRMADSGVDKKSIVTDDENLSNIADVEQNDSKLCTLLTVYERINGEVYISRYTKTAMVTAPRPLAPDKKAAKDTELYRQLSADIDEALPTDDVDNEKQDEVEARAKATLFPVFHWAYKERRNCFYGKSLTETLISDQKTINTTYGLLMLGAQIEATGKTYVKHGALRGQVLTNNPLQVVTDFYTGGQGIYKLPPAQMNNAAVMLVDTLVKYVRFTNNVTEINTGEAYGANASGSAIAQLQSQASQATDSIREDLWEALEDFGRILKQCFELYFSGPQKQSYKYKVRVPDEAGVLHDSSVEGEYDGSQFAEEENSLYDVQIKAIKGTRSSVSGDIQMLEAMLQGQLLTAIEFVEMYPDDALTEKERLISVLKTHQSEQLAQLQQSLSQEQQKGEQLIKVIGQLSNTIKQNQGTMEAAYRILNAEEALKTQTIKEAATRMNTQASLAMAEVKAQNAENALNNMALDVVRGNVGAPQIKNQPPITQRKRTLAEEEEEI